MSIAVVWLKRDLRLQDHQPLYEAAATGLPVLLLYCFEPILLNDPHYSSRHWRFVHESLVDIQQRLPTRALYCSHLNALETFALLQQRFQIAAIYSHQEVGLANTFERDKGVANWCQQHNINWFESPYAAVIRGLSQRHHWDKHWQTVMRSTTFDVDVNGVNWCEVEEAQLMNIEASNEGFQRGGETSAWQVMDDFYHQRGKDYAYSLSSPQLSQRHCSRLSAHLAWGNLSLRQVYQTLLSHWQRPGWRRSLVALSARLHWHCHFIQKFESECRMEFEPVNRGYFDLPRAEGEQAKQYLVAWQQGQTGIPMVDACMRCLLATGYINFRMRAMLVSFLCHHLAVDWRSGVAHLAALFLDFEPGIHYSQFQMQAGVTGINTIRIYSPVKQGLEKDPDGEFVKKWCPELAELPAQIVHTPWQMTDMEQLFYGVKLGVDYPEPIVDLKVSYKAAQALLWQWRDKPKVKQEASRLLQRHVRLT